jgi:hypothetical protein
VIRNQVFGSDSPAVRFPTEYTYSGVRFSKSEKGPRQAETTALCDPASVPLCLGAVFPHCSFHKLNSSSSANLLYCVIYLDQDLTQHPNLSHL